MAYGNFISLCKETGNPQLCQHPSIWCLPRDLKYRTKKSKKSKLAGTLPNPSPIYGLVQYNYVVANNINTKNGRNATQFPTNAYQFPITKVLFFKYLTNGICLNSL